MTKIPVTFWISRTGEGTKEHAFSEEVDFPFLIHDMMIYDVWICNLDSFATVGELLSAFLAHLTLRHRWQGWSIAEANQQQQKCSFYDASWHLLRCRNSSMEVRWMKKAQSQSPISPSYGVSICLQQRGWEHLGVWINFISPFELISLSMDMWTSPL